MKNSARDQASLVAWTLGGAALGALAMYLADPHSGRRRRAEAADKLRSASSKTRDALSVASRDMSNRVQGLRAEANRLLSDSGMPADNEHLLAQVRQKIGRSRDFARQSNWAPSTRTALLLGGGALAAYALTRRKPLGAMIGSGAVALMARGADNLSFRRMAGMEVGRQAIDLYKTIHIDASPEAVFDFWNRYENFPLFMSNVRDVRDHGNGRSHWVVRGPAGTNVEWDAEIVESRRPHVLSWKSDPDSTVQNSGTIRFEPEGDGTRMSVQMSYSPPAGIIGQLVATLFNRNPERQMEDDLQRMKTFIETGEAPQDTARPQVGKAATLH